MKLQKKDLKFFTIIFVLAFFIGGILAACGGGGGSAENTEPESATIEVLQNDIYYGDTPDNVENPPIWTVSTGQQVTVQLTNNGTLEHNWAIVKPDVALPETFDPETDSDIILYDTGLVEGTSEYNDVFVAPAPGEYDVICTVPGHFPGMQGRLVVEE